MHVCSVSATFASQLVTVFYSKLMKLERNRTHITAVIDKYAMGTNLARLEQLTAESGGDTAKSRCPVLDTASTAKFRFPLQQGNAFSKA